MYQQLCEDVAYRMGFIDRGRSLRLAEPLQKSGYGDHLRCLADETGRPRQYSKTG